jgi:E3 ubiquitin-protein ligase DMA1/2
MTLPPSYFSLHCRRGCVTPGFQSTSICCTRLPCYDQLDRYGVLQSSSTTVGTYHLRASGKKGPIVCSRSRYCLRVAGHLRRSSQPLIRRSHWKLRPPTVAPDVCSPFPARLMLSPAVSAPVAEGVNLHSSSSRRRALSYLRHLSHSSQIRPGSGSGSPTGADSPRQATSPRSYFHRSTSYPEPSRVHHSRQRSNTRPNDREAVDHLVNEATSRLNNPIADLRSVSPAAGETTNTDNEAAPEEQSHSDDMARNRRNSSDGVAASLTTSNTRPRSQRATTSTTTGSATDPAADTPATKATTLPAIRFFPHLEARGNGRPPLSFTPISRTLPNGDAIIRVGRYSEREGVPNPNPTGPSDAPVGFKSKVVSRKHCEFNCSDGQWHIKDVASSSGTFLNHVRLSPPNTESKLFPVKDGDIVQLGIDFRGGEEQIFRCVKIRIECNRSWQKKPNNFK